MSYDRVALFVRARELLDADLGMELREVARRLKIHRHTVETVIVNQAGCNFIVWRRGRRLSTAKRLLRDSVSLSEKEVAALCGLTATSLDRLFRRHFNLTPTEFRELPPGSDLRRHRRKAKATLAARARKRTRG